MIKFLICLMSFFGFFFVFGSMIHAILGPFAESPEAGRDPDNSLQSECSEKKD